MKAISCKKHWISTGGYYGYEEPLNAVCGANNTGNWPDSPAPSNVCESELKLAKDILKRNNIPYRTMVCRSSNVFCIHVYLVTHSHLVDQAKELIRPLISSTELLYV
jgi:hypothetical protein